MKPNVRRTAEMLSLNAELDAIARRLDEARRVCDDGYPNLAMRPATPSAKWSSSTR